MPSRCARGFVALLLPALLMAACAEPDRTERLPTQDGATVPGSTTAQAGAAEQHEAAGETVAVGGVARAEEAVAVLRDRRWEALATLVHPSRGVRFSPYAHVRPEADVRLSRAEVARLGADTTRYLWGYEDGSGAPIRLPFAGYYQKYVYDKDFASKTSARRGAPGEILRTGNTLSNLADVYAGDATFVSFHVPGSEQYDGMDWASLRLVFERTDGTWYLVGIIHDQWTI